MESIATDAVYNLGFDFFSNPLVLRLQSKMDQTQGMGQFNLNVDSRAYAVYAVPLLAFLISPEVKATSVTTDHFLDGPEVTIDGTIFQHNYVSGYVAGIEFFQKEYLVPPATIYSSQQYLDTLYERCFITTHEGGMGGWFAEVHASPLTVSQSQIWKHGYWAGIYNQVEDLKKKYKVIEDALNRQSNVTKSSSNTERQSANFNNDNQLDRYQPFLDEVAAIENSIGKNGTYINPTFYDPVRTLWERMSSVQIAEARDLYREGVKQKVEDSNDYANALLIEYNTAVKKQPEKRKELLIKYRDKYVGKINEKYRPIEKWFIESEDETSRLDERVAQIEMEVFHFCYQENKPFMVGLNLLYILYMYRCAIDKLNKQLLTYTDLTLIVKKQPEKLIFNSFEDCFVNPKEIERCVNALRLIQPPLINDTGKWIKRKGSKAKFAAWIRRLEYCDKIYYMADKKQMVPLINSYFAGLDFGSEARTFADPDQEALTDFTALILQ